VLAYHVGRAELSDAEADEHARLVAATGKIENMSAAISRELARWPRPSGGEYHPFERDHRAAGATVPDVRRRHSALLALVGKDEQAAQTVVASRDAISNSLPSFSGNRRASH
jgi:hypothetical protein